MLIISGHPKLEDLNAVKTPWISRQSQNARVSKVWRGQSTGIGNWTKNDKGYDQMLGLEWPSFNPTTLLEALVFKHWSLQKDKEQSAALVRPLRLAAVTEGDGVPKSNALMKICSAPVVELCLWSLSPFHPFRKPRYTWLESNSWVLSHTLEAFD